MGAAASVPKPFSQETQPLPYYSIVGQSGAGKTTILYHLKFGKFASTTPSLSENFETIEYICHDNSKRVFGLWDVTQGGGRALREFATWRGRFPRHFYGTIFVIDSAARDPTSIALATEQLKSIVRKNGRSSLRLPLLIMANKQDSPIAMTVAEIKDILGLEDLPSEQLWHIQGVSTPLGAGIRDGIDWLMENTNISR